MTNIVILILSLIAYGAFIVYVFGDDSSETEAMGEKFVSDVKSASSFEGSRNEWNEMMSKLEFEYRIFLMMAGKQTKKTYMRMSSLIADVYLARVELNILSKAKDSFYRIV